MAPLTAKDWKEMLGESSKNLHQENEQKAF